MSGRGSTKSERYRPTTNEKPSETMFQRVLLDFVLKTFGLGAENESLTLLFLLFECKILQFFRFTFEL